MPGSGSSNPNGNVGGGWGADGSNSGGNGSFGSGGGSTAQGGQGGQGGSGSGGSYNSNSSTPPGLTTGYVGSAGTNKGAWSGDGQYLGLSTGPKIYGNAAYGPSGGSAIAHATISPASLAAMGMGPTYETYSNFRTPTGQSMFSNIGGQSFTAPNFGSAMQQASIANQRMMAGTQRPGATSAPPPPVAPPPTPRPAVQRIQGWLPSWPGTGQWWGNMPRGSYPAASQPAVMSSNFGPRAYDGGYISSVKAGSPANNPSYGHVGDGSLSAYGGSSSSGWGPGGNPEGGYGSGGAKFGY